MLSHSSRSYVANPVFCCRRRHFTLEKSSFQAAMFLSSRSAAPVTIAIYQNLKRKISLCECVWNQTRTMPSKVMKSTLLSRHSSGFLLIYIWDGSLTGWMIAYPNLGRPWKYHMKFFFARYCILLEFHVYNSPHKPWRARNDIPRSTFWITQALRIIYRTPMLQFCSALSSGNLTTTVWHILELYYATQVILQKLRIVSFHGSLHTFRPLLPTG